VWHRCERYVAMAAAVSATGPWHRRWRRQPRWHLVVAIDELTRRRMRGIGAADVGGTRCPPLRLRLLGSLLPASAVRQSGVQRPGESADHLPGRPGTRLERIHAGLRLPARRRGAPAFVGGLGGLGGKDLEPTKVPVPHQREGQLCLVTRLEALPHANLCRAVEHLEHAAEVVSQHSGTLARWDTGGRGIGG
jgi:hypothetical protein